MRKLQNFTKKEKKCLKIDHKEPFPTVDCKLASPEGVPACRDIHVDSRVRSGMSEKQSVEFGRWISEGLVRKIIYYWQKHLLTHDLHGSTLLPTFLDTDRWIQRERYGGSNMDEKMFSIVFNFYILYYII